MSKILFVVTGAQHWTLADGTQHPTGFWAEELVAPYRAFTGAGHDVVVATPGGVVPVVDEASLAADANGGQENADAIRAELERIGQLHAPLKLEDVDLDDYAAVFYPGGHGPMEDLAVDADLGEPARPCPGLGQAAGGRVPCPGRAPGHPGRPGRLAVRRLPAHRLHQRRGEAGRPRRQGDVAAGGPARRPRRRLPGRRPVGARTSWSTATSTPARTPPRPLRWRRRSSRRSTPERHCRRGGHSSVRGEPLGARHEAPWWV